MNPRGTHVHEAHFRQVLDLWTWTAMWSVWKLLINEAKQFSMTPNLEKENTQLADWYTLQFVIQHLKWSLCITCTEVTLKSLSSRRTLANEVGTFILLSHFSQQFFLPMIVHSSDSSQNVVLKISLQGWISSHNFISAQRSPYLQILPISIPPWNQTDSIDVLQMKKHSNLPDSAHMLKNSPLGLKKESK